MHTEETEAGNLEVALIDALKSDGDVTGSVMSAEPIQQRKVPFSKVTAVKWSGKVVSWSFPGRPDYKRINAELFGAYKYMFYGAVVEYSNSHGRFFKLVGPDGKSKARKASPRAVRYTVENMQHDAKRGREYIVHVSGEPFVAVTYTDSGCILRTSLSSLSGRQCSVIDGNLAFANTNIPIPMLDDNEGDTELRNIQPSLGRRIIPQINSIGGRS